MVCFGSLALGTVILTDRFPDRDAGGYINSLHSYPFQDAAIVACLLSRWGVPTTHIGTMVGEDEAGREVVEGLRAWGVTGQPRTKPDVATLRQYVISDRGGGRTWLAQHDANEAKSLKSAELSPIDSAAALYVDWYDGEAVTPAMERANDRGATVFLNVEQGHADADVLRNQVRRSTLCQATMPSPPSRTEAVGVARRLLRAGAETALVTLGARGCVAMNSAEAVAVEAPPVTVLDTCAAGATFSAAFLYAEGRSRTLAESAAFAVAAASLKCTVAGLRAFPVDEVERLAESLTAKDLGGA